MGWLSSSAWPTRQTLVKHIITTNTGTRDNGTEAAILAHCLRGNVLWAVLQLKKGDEQHRYILCILTQKFSHARDFDQEWGYKDMSESVHPYYYSCPLKYLDMVPEVACQEWRDEVHKYHAKRKASR